MIRSDSEYRESRLRLEAERDRLAEYRARLADMGLGPDERERALSPALTFHKKLEQEIEVYERLKKGDLTAFSSLRALGPLLIGARIARGWSQRELAQRVGVGESQVSRDERGDYSGMTLDRAWKILEALDVEVRVQAFLKPVSTTSLAGDAATARPDPGNFPHPSVAPRAPDGVPVNHRDPS